MTTTETATTVYKVVYPDDRRRDTGGTSEAWFKNRPAAERCAKLSKGKVQELRMSSEEVKVLCLSKLLPNW